MVAISALSVLAADVPEVNKLLTTISKVGREGKGNPETAKAWKELVAYGDKALFPILDALKDDDKYASNWLRPAYDAIVEKAEKLDPKKFESYVKDVTKQGVSRRLAYETLCSLDKTAPERLLPGMLLDPSPELRRDAVQRVIDEAEAAYEIKKPDVDPKEKRRPKEKPPEEKKEKEDAKEDTPEIAKAKAKAKELYLKALTGAADPDQVEGIAAALKVLKHEVDLQKHFGIVTDWHLIAPFDHSKQKGWNVAYPPEKEINLKASYEGKGKEEATWVPFTTKEDTGLVNLNKVLGVKKGAVGYAVAFVESPKEQTVDFRAGCINGIKIFLNGKEIFGREEYHHGMSIDQYTSRGTLKKGKNTILLKICQNEQKEPWAQNWMFQLRLCDAVGSAVPFTNVKNPAKEETR
jgi:hypothetical protein